MKIPLLLTQAITVIAILIVLCIDGAHAQWRPLEGPGFSEPISTLCVLDSAGHKHWTAIGQYHTFTSTDAGLTWMRSYINTTQGVDGGITRGFALLGQYAVVPTQGSYSTSIDYGRMWDHPVGIPWDAQGFDLSAIGQRGEDIWIGLTGKYSGFHAGSAISISKDASNSMSHRTAIKWSPLFDSGICFDCTPHAFAFLNGSAFLATDHGILRSTNEGHLWTQVLHTSDGKASSICTIGDRMLCGYDNYLRLSSNGGDDWNINAQFPDTVITLLTDRTIVYVTTQKGGIYRSSDSGRTWSVRNTNIPTNCNIISFAASGDTLLAGSDVNGCIFRSIDGGITWHRSVAGTADVEIENVRVEDSIFYFQEFSTRDFNGALYKTSNLISNASRIAEYYSTVATHKNHIVGSHALNTFTSFDYGDSWIQSHDSITFNQLAAVDTDFFGLNAGSIWKSTDCGLHWKKLDWQSNVSNISSCGSVLFSYCNNYISFFSLNHGNSWDTLSYEVTSPINDIRDVGAVVLGNKLIISKSYNALFESDNHGKTWDSCNNGLPSFVSSKLFSIQDRYLFARSDGLFISIDSARSWVSINDGLPNMVDGFNYNIVESLALYQDTLYAGTSNLGLWCRPLSEIVQNARSSVVNRSALSAQIFNQPNPFAKNTIIHLSKLTSGIAELNVYDYKGDMVSHAKRDLSYEDEILFERGTLPAGVYFYRVMAGNTIQSGSMVIQN